MFFRMKSETTNIAISKKNRFGFICSSSMNLVVWSGESMGIFSYERWNRKHHNVTWIRKVPAIRVFNLSDTA